MKFVNLYIQSEYTMLGSSIAIDSLINKAKSEHITTLAITDDLMHGAIKFYQGCVNNNIKPIIGLRCRLTNNNYILLYAKSYLGYQNLLQLASIVAINEEATLQQLQQYSVDLIAIIPSDENEVVKLYKSLNYEKSENMLLTYRDIFLNDLYLGIDLQTSELHNIAQNLYDFASKLGVESVAIHKTLYLEKNDFEVYTSLKCISLGISNYAFTEKETNAYFINQETANRIFYFLPKLIENTQVISDKCNLELSFGNYKLPNYDRENSNKYLQDLCKVGLNKRLASRKVDVTKYRDRLLYELDIIEKMGFSDYFLIVYDYVKYAKKNKILVGPGRGSAPGSLVSYSLGITDIDPIEYDLLFERFLNPERITMPDIDVDFPDDKRDDVIRYMGRRFGKSRVAHISTFGTFGPRMALRDIARIKNINTQKLELILKYIPSNASHIASVIRENLELQQMIARDEEIKTLFYLASKIEGLPRHISTHAAGIIMADQDLVSYTPLQKGINDLYQTQYEARDLEALGLVKMDILGLKNLTIIQKVIDNIQNTSGIKINPMEIPLNDPKVFQMISKGHTDGIFQLESKGMREVLIKLKTSHFMDIVNANALYRPGPMEMIPTFIARKFNKEPITYLHQDLKEILESTYGTIVFQEQIMLIAQKFAGYSLGAADILRRAVSKKDESLIIKERKRFVDSAVRKGYPESISNEIYDYIAKFANYGFNKSHSVAYAHIAYVMAYLKVHYYQYFMAVLMTNSLGSVRLLQNYVTECKKNNIEIYSPDINKSSNIFEVDDNGIYFSLLAVNNIGNVIVDKIIEERKKGLFKTYEDFIIRCRNFINKRIITNLIHAGAFDSFSLTKREMDETYEEILQRQEYSVTLGDKIVVSKKSYPEYSFDEMSLMEKEALGFNLKHNLFVKYYPIKKKEKTTDLIKLQENTIVRILFIIKSIKKIHTKKGNEMAFLEIYDDTASCDAVMFPVIYSKYKEILEVGSTYIARG
ncbi:MAG TPA: DNA polymerase III subunit alpha, partial [Acholeplasmataceae bacterium]|nr:DNA polymerase III subunit alpha [Acholeplasmataceae bacterium]